MGINFGLRCGDLISLRVGDVVAPNGEFVSTFRIIEEKTGKVRAMAMNGSVIHALRLYIDNRYGTRPVDRRDFLFTSESNNKRKYNDDLKAPASRYSEEAGNIPLTVRSAERILKKIVNDECNITVHASTHMLRKTFAYHFLMEAPDRNRALELLSMQLNHSSVAYTLRYIGITQKEILDTCFKLDLGFESDVNAAPNVVNIADIRERKERIIQA